MAEFEWQQIDGSRHLITAATDYGMLPMPPPPRFLLLVGIVILECCVIVIVSSIVKVATGALAVPCTTLSAADLLLVGGASAFLPSAAPYCCATAVS